MKRIGIQLDAVVALRTLGGGALPDPLHAIAMLEMAGVDSIVYTMTGQPNEPRDLKIIKDAIHSHFNLRMSPSMDNAQMALSARAEMVTLASLAGGAAGTLDVVANESSMAPVVSLLRTNGVVVNAFIETDANQVRTAARMGCDYVEFNAYKYTHAASITLMEQELNNMKEMALAANKLKLGVSVTGDLHYGNIQPLLAIPEIEEINVGHSIVARALFVGFDQAARDLAAIIKKS